MTAEIALELIQSTMTQAVLKADARIVETDYPAGCKISENTYSTKQFGYFRNDTKWNYMVSGFKSALFNTACDVIPKKPAGEEFK